jgi:hypothetical protein
VCLWFYIFLYFFELHITARIKHLCLYRTFFSSPPSCLPYQSSSSSLFLPSTTSSIKKVKAAFTFLNSWLLLARCSGDTLPDRGGSWKK